MPSYFSLLFPLAQKGPPAPARTANSYGQFHLAHFGFARKRTKITGSSHHSHHLLYFHFTSNEIIGNLIWCPGREHSVPWPLSSFVLISLYFVCLPACLPVCVVSVSFSLIFNVAELKLNQHLARLTTTTTITITLTSTQHFAHTNGQFKKWAKTYKRSKNQCDIFIIF